MAKTQTKQKTNRNRLTVNQNVAGAARRRLPEIQDAVEGISRLRANRWPGQTSLYDTNRLQSLVEDLAFSESISKSRILSLQSEVKSFSAVLGPQLTRPMQAAKII